MDAQVELYKTVSIPFKREGISKVPKNLEAMKELLKSFNSLQTGRHIQSIELAKGVTHHNEFQFPSNGKAYPKAINPSKTAHFDRMFQFPSNGKAYPKSNKH